MALIVSSGKTLLERADPLKRSGPVPVAAGNRRAFPAPCFDDDRD